jgi:hypothetical protein
MKSLIKIITLTLVTLTTTHNFGFTIAYKNETTKPLVLKTMLRASLTGPFYQIVQPSETIEYNTLSALCLENIWYAPYDSKKPMNGGADLITTNANGKKNIPSTQQTEFEKSIRPHYAFVPIVIQSNADDKNPINLCANLVISITSTGKTDRRTRYEILNATVTSSSLLP